MAKREKYNVYIISYGWGCYKCIDGRKEFVGSTMAVSPKQAINNVRYRNEGKNTNSWFHDDYLEEGSGVSTYIAELAE